MMKSLRSLLLINCALLSMAYGQAQSVPDTVDASDKENPFSVPEGTVEELLQFINKVKQIPPTERTRAAIVAHLKLQVTAVNQALTRIEKTEPDDGLQVRILAERLAGFSVLQQVDEQAAKQLEALLVKHAQDDRPAIKAMVGSYRLEQQARHFPSLSSAQRKAYVDRLFQHINDAGLDQRSLGVATSLSELLESSTELELGATVNERLAAVFEKMNRPEIQPNIDRLKAIARRFRLPGNPIRVLGSAVDGSDFDWKSYRGKYVLIDFWASWCGPCRAEIPNMKAQQKRYSTDDFAIVGINLDQTPDDCQKYVEREELPWVNLMSQDAQQRGWDNPMAVYYGISGIPTAILVDREGRVISMQARGEELNRLLESLLGKPETDDQ